MTPGGCTVMLSCWFVFLSGENGCVEGEVEARRRALKADGLLLQRLRGLQRSCSVEGYTYEPPFPVFCIEKRVWLRERGSEGQQLQPRGRLTAIDRALTGC